MDIRRALAVARQADVNAQTDLVVAFYKVARAAKGDEKDAAIDEGIEILAKLDTAGQLNDDQKGWKDSFLSLREEPTP